MSYTEEMPMLRSVFKADPHLAKHLLSKDDPTTVPSQLFIGAPLSSTPTQTTLIRLFRTYTYPGKASVPKFALDSGFDGTAKFAGISTPT